MRTTNKEKLIKQGWKINKDDQEYPVKGYEYLSIGLVLYKRKMELTEKQTEVLNFIKGFIKKNKYSPSIREICKNFGWKSPKSSQYMVEELERKGFITKNRRSHRSISIVEQ